MWNTCNAACDHCAVSSNPKDRTTNSDEDIRRLIDQCCADDPEPSIGLSGGEAFLYFPRLIKIIEYARERGAKVSVNTNCYWANSREKALDLVRQIKDAGLTKLVVSTDEFHLKYIPAERVINAILACKDVHLEVDLQFVSTKRSYRLADFLEEHGDDLLNISCREIPCHPVGEARKNIAEEDLFIREGVPLGLCPSAVMSISAKGDVIPCCNTAGHLPALRIGDVREPLRDLHDKFRTSAVMQILCAEGPATFLDAAEKAGYHRERGYVDQCHLCYDLFKNERIALSLKEFAATKMSEVVYSFLKGLPCGRYGTHNAPKQAVQKEMSD